MRDDPPVSMISEYTEDKHYQHTRSSAKVHTDSWCLAAWLHRGSVQALTYWTTTGARATLQCSTNSIRASREVEHIEDIKIQEGLQQGGQLVARTSSRSSE